MPTSINTRMCRCSGLPTLSLRQVLLWRIDAQASWSRRGRRRSCWYNDHDAALDRLTIGRIIGRNEVVLDLRWGSDIQTRLVFSQRSEKRCPRLPHTWEPTAAIDAISRKIRFIVGNPCQRGTPRSARPQYKNSGDGSYPVHMDTSIYSPALLGWRLCCPDHSSTSPARSNRPFGPMFFTQTFHQITRHTNRHLTTVARQRRLNRSGPFAV